MRPQIKYKTRIPRKKPPKLTAEQRVEAARARNLARTELNHDLTPVKVNHAIIKARGLLSEVCRHLKVPRTTLVRYIEKHEVCLETLGQARDEMGDLAESRLFEHIEHGDIRCLLYYLSTVHRHRGYGLNNADTPADPTNRGPVYVDTINIVGVEPGTFLPKDVARRDNTVIEHQTEGD